MSKALSDNSDMTDHPKDFAKRLAAEPRAADALYVLDMIDNKVSPLATFIGIMIAALFVLLAPVSDPAFDPSGQANLAVKANLILFFLAAVFALSCISITDARRLLDEPENEEFEREIDKIVSTAQSRWYRYVCAFVLTVSGVVLTAGAALFLI